MSERDIVEKLEARCSYGDARLWQRHDPLSAEAAAEILRLRSALANAKRAGWITGRDAAAEALARQGHHQAVDLLRNMEPPA